MTGKLYALRNKNDGEVQNASDWVVFGAGKPPDKKRQMTKQVSGRGGGKAAGKVQNLVEKRWREKYSVRAVASVKNGCLFLAVYRFCRHTRETENRLWQNPRWRQVRGRKAFARRKKFLGINGKRTNRGGEVF